MGSALCFPIECLVFASVCEYVKRKNGLHGVFSEYHVYGDDIVFPSAHVREVMQYLEELGFTVNNSKSFVVPRPRNFRESCGGEYIDGIDVTPLRIPRNFSGGPLDPGHPDQISSRIDLANQLYRKGYLGCREYLVYTLLKLPSHARPIFGLVGSRILTDNPTNYRSKKRFNRSLYRSEVRGPIFGRDREPIQHLPSRDSSGKLVAPTLSVAGDTEFALIEQCRYLQYWLEKLDSEGEKTLSTASGFWDYARQCIISEPRAERTSVGLIGDLRIKVRWLPAIAFNNPNP